MLKAGYKPKPAATPVHYAQRVAIEKLSLQRRYCDAFAEVEKLLAPSRCRRNRNCRGDAAAV